MGSGTKAFLHVFFIIAKHMTLVIPDVKQERLGLYTLFCNLSGYYQTYPA